MNKLSIMALGITFLVGCASGPRAERMTVTSQSAAAATADDLTGPWRLVTESTMTGATGRIALNLPISLRQTGTNITGTLADHTLVGSSDGSNVTITDKRGEVIYRGHVIDGYHMQGNIEYRLPEESGTWSATRTTAGSKGWSQTIGPR